MEANPPDIDQQVRVIYIHIHFIVTYGQLNVSVCRSLDCVKSAFCWSRSAKFYHSHSVHTSSSGAEGFFVHRHSWSYKP